jgi:hypothetical protein
MFADLQLNLTLLPSPFARYSLLFMQGWHFQKSCKYFLTLDFICKSYECFAGKNQEEGVNASEKAWHSSGQGLMRQL